MYSLIAVIPNIMLNFILHFKKCIVDSLNIKIHQETTE